VPHAGQVGVDRVLPDPRRDVVPLLDGADAGVRGDDVELAEFGDAVVDRLPQRAGVADVGLGGDDPAVECLDLLDGLGEVGLGGMP
jgi:hypothetical protein